VTPLTFNVRAADGRLLDRFTEDDLTCVAYGRPEKSWHEASLWAALAIEKDRRLQGLDDKDREVGVELRVDHPDDAENTSGALRDRVAGVEVRPGERNDAEALAVVGDHREPEHGGGGDR
jgi:hypothetical protein